MGHRDLNVPDRIEAKTGGYPVLDDVDEGGGDLRGIVALDKMKVGILSCCGELWQLPGANSVR